MPSPSGSTTKYGFQYPFETDVPDVATALQDLAQDIETVMNTVATISRQAAATMVLPGVVNTGDLFVSPHSAANMTVNVAAGGGWVPGTLSVPAQRNYFYYNPTTVNLSIASNVSGNPRLDAVVLTVKDSDFGGSVDVPGLLQVITGTPSGTPVLPTLPANSLLLAQVAVASGSSSITTPNITNVAPLAANAFRLRGDPYARGDLPSPMFVIPANTPTQITLSTTFASGITPGSNAFTIVTPGRYRIHGDLSAPAMQNVGDAAFIAIHINSFTTKQIQDAADAAGVCTPSISTLVSLVAGDIVSLWFEQSVVGGFGAEVSTAELSLELVSI